MHRISIVHYQPLEGYPPVMNIINDLSELENNKLFVITTNGVNNWFSNKNTFIKRIAFNSHSSIKRYFEFIQFNLIGTYFLFKSKPQTILTYETYSLFPVFVYSTFCKTEKIIIHYHEYISPEEIATSSLYFKFLCYLEKKIYNRNVFVSHTNQERMDLFLNQHPTINKTNTIISPNYPPSNWYKYARENRIEKKIDIIKLVHVGALSLESMYVKEIVEWVLNQNGKYILHFYTDNIEPETKKYLESIKSESINLFGSINYFDLPKILINYDIGLTIYKGHIPNHIYSVPNKIYEYLACGLQVWYSDKLISTKKFVETEKIEGCYEVDFSKINIEENINNSWNDNIDFLKSIKTNEIIKLIKMN